MTDISRYAADNAATYNAALQSLEDLFLRVGNTVEPIASGTLATATSTIDLSVSSTEWRCVRLITNLQRGSGVAAVYDLYANYDRSKVYGFAELDIVSSASGVSTINATGISLTISLANDFAAFVDTWIYFTPLGFLLLSSGSYEGSTSADIRAYRYGGYGMAGAVSSLQLGINGTFAVGGTYILEGIRA